MSCSLVHRSNIPIFPVLQSIWRNSCCTETHRTRSPVWWPAACLAGCRFGSLPPRFFFPCISRTCRPWKLQQQASLRSFCIQITSPPSAHASPCVFTGWSDEAAHSSLFYPEKSLAVGCVWLIIRRLKDEKVLLTETLKALKKLDIPVTMDTELRAMILASQSPGNVHYTKKMFTSAIRV